MADPETGAPVALHEESPLTQPGPMTISDAAAELARGTTTSEQLVRLALSRIDSADDRLGVFVSVQREAALEAAARCDAGRRSGVPTGPLHGIPVGLKDNVGAAGTRTTAQSVVTDGGRDTDSTVAARLRAAGAIVLGKTTLMEFGCGLPDASKPFPIPRNPWDLRRWPGGSSSGTASGVAAAMILGGIGTDTGGSIRMPAAFCGVTGLVPTFGRVPRTGCLPLAYSLDHVGPIARSARDCALLLQAIAGHDPLDPVSARQEVPDFSRDLGRDLSGLRIGVDRLTRHGASLRVAEVDVALDAALDVLRDAGAVVSPIELPLFEQLSAAADVIYAGEMLAEHLPTARTRLSDYAASTRVALGVHALYSAADYVQAQRVRRVAAERLDRIYDDVDLVLTPTAGIPAIDAGDFGESFHEWFEVIWTPYWNPTGRPLVALPMGATTDGLPLGLQLAGRPFDEVTVLRAADAFQQRTGWHLRTPDPLRGGVRG